MRINELVKQILLIGLVVSPLLTGATLSLADSNSVKMDVKQCGLLDDYKEWLSFLKEFPSSHRLKGSVHFDSYVEVATSIRNEDQLPKEHFGKAYVELIASNLLLKSAWIDSRIVEIVKYRELCNIGKNEAELVILYDDVYGNKKYKIIPFVHNNEIWLRGFTMTSGYSYIEEKGADELLDEI